MSKVSDIVSVSPWPGSTEPVYSIKDGHTRMATSVAKDGAGYFAFGFSNIPVSKSTMNYEQKEDETVVTLFCLKVRKAETVTLMAATLAELAKEMAEVQGNGTDDIRDEPGGDV